MPIPSSKIRQSQQSAPSDAELKFWSFVSKRQQAWAHKLGLAPDPGDPVLRRAQIINVWRRLDRGTLFVEHELLSRAAPERAYAVVAYRTLNRVDSFRALLDPFPGTTELASRITVRRESGGKVFTGAYQSTGVLQVVDAAPQGLVSGLQPMDQRLVVFSRRLWESRGELARRLDSAASLERAVSIIRDSAPGVKLGPFAAHQAALDLDYCYRWTDKSDHWVHVGPGAEEGLRLIGATPSLASLRELTARQLAIEWAPRLPSGARVRLALADVEHALCEYQKYARATGGGHEKPYRPTVNAWSPPSWVPPGWRVPTKSF